MCNYIQIESDIDELEEAYQAEYIGSEYARSFKINGFANPNVPVILDQDTDHIRSAQWGFLPNWAKDTEFAKKTLNARMEEVHEKPSYKKSVNNRCLVLVNGFHEWKWLDEKGKKKDHYLIKVKDQNIFAIGGLYNVWTNPATNEEVLTCTIGTTAANDLMSKIHVTRLRMPILLNKMNEYHWLDDEPVENFLFPHYDPELEAENLTNLEQAALF